jgi:23S rRNA pseudouridine2605 synthase
MKAEMGDDSDHESLREDQGVRLQRFLASTGLGSRRKCEEIIVAGRVTVDGEVRRDLGTRVDPRRQRVSVDGHSVRQEPHRYYLLNKPAGFLCTNSDPAGRPRAIDLVPAGRLRLFTVGRLDESSEGLILITNDGELAHRLAHPRFQVPRTYSVQVAGRPTPETFAALKSGQYFHEGRFHLKWIRRIGTRGNSSYLEVGLDHGQNREIRRLFARVGHKVMRLKRVAFGPLSLGRLAEGRFRPLTNIELAELRKLSSRPRRRRPKPVPEPSVAAVTVTQPAAAGRPREKSRQEGSRPRETARPRRPSRPRRGAEQEARGRERRRRKHE